MHGPMGESFYTKSVVSLIGYIQSSTPLKDSLFEQAELYFETSDKVKKENLTLQKNIAELEESLEKAPKKSKELIAEKINVVQLKVKVNDMMQQEERTNRLNGVLNVCTKLLSLCESVNWDKTQVNSAKFLGTLQLLSPGEGPTLPKLHQTLKPAYKAVVALRLLDKLLADKQLSTKYILQGYDESLRFPAQEGELTTFQRNVAIPIIIAALFQDIGLFHPSAQLILKGEDGTRDEFGVLEKEDRIALLKINHEQTLDYITNGLGIERYIGNSKEEREVFEQQEKERLKFTRTLLVSALKPKLGVGNLIKIPQIYASCVFSSKPTYSLLDLPKVGLIIRKAAERDSVSEVAAECLLSIVGHFPQGYGVAYIPKYDGVSSTDSYEYAIVVGLNPKDPFVPVCRAVSRNLTFISSGQTINISADNNLYFPAAKKKIEKIHPDRLKEILRLLVSNFDERKKLDLIPSFWNPYEYFKYEKLQNLWKKT